MAEEKKYRVESDLLGELKVPAEAYYGVQTQRAINNYHISRKKMRDYPDYVIAIGHRGRMDLMYDDIADYSEQHTVGVIFPSHTLRKVSVTDDYLATLIIVDASVINDPMLQVVSQMR